MFHCYVNLPEGTLKRRRGGLVNITLFKGIECVRGVPARRKIRCVDLHFVQQRVQYIFKGLSRGNGFSF